MQPTILKSILLTLLIVACGFCISHNVYAQNCIPQISTTGSTDICSSGQVTLTASDADSYLWSTGATTKSITVTVSGNYWVTTTKDGCEGTSETVKVTDTPDATFTDPVYSSFNFCTSTSGTAAYEFTIENASTTKETNQRYTVKWGDGTTESFGADFNTATHTYNRAGYYNIEVTATSASGCTGSKRETLFIGSNPGLGISSSGNNTDCAPASYQFKVEGIDGNSSSTIYTFQFDDGTPVETYTHSELIAKGGIITHEFRSSSLGKPQGFTLTGTAENRCSVSRASFTGIRISKPPVAGLKLNDTGCINEPFRLQDASQKGYDAPSNTENHRRKWEITPATGWEIVSGTLESANPVIKFTVAGQYTIKLKVSSLDPSSNCGGEQEIQKVVTIGEPPIVEVSSPKLTICYGESTTLVASGAQRYSWSPATGLSSTTGNSVVASPATTTTYTVTGTGPNGCSTSRTITVEVKQLPPAPVVDEVTLCWETSTTLKVKNPEGDIFWYSSEQSDTPLHVGSEFQTPVLTETTTYFVKTSIDGGCPSTRTPVTVTVLPATPAPVVEPVTLCGVGLTATLVAEGDAELYNWYDSESKSNLLFTGKSYTTEPLSEDKTYYVEAVSNNCPSPLVAVTVTVLDSYVNNISNNIITGPEAQICSGQAPGAIRGLQPEGGEYPFTYRWEQSTVGPTEGFSIIEGEKDMHLQPGVLTQPTWFRRIAISGPCAENASEAVLIAVLPAISNNIVSENQTICTGDVPLAFTGTVPEGGNGDYTYRWEVSLNGVNFSPATGDNNKEGYTAPAPLTNTTWYRRVVISGPCQENASSPVKVTVLPKIANNILSPQEQEACYESIPGTISGLKPTGGNNSYTYLWEHSKDGVNFAIAPGVNTNSSYTPTVLTEDTWFRRKVSSGNCYDFSAPVKVIVNDLIADNNITESQAICIGAVPTKLTGSQPTGGNGTYTFVWEYSTTNTPGSFKPVSAGGRASDYQPEALYETTYFRRVVNSGACSAPSNVVTVFVYPEMSRNTIALSQNIYHGQVPAPLTGSVPNGGNGSFTYQWEYSEDGVNFSSAAEPNTGKNYAPQALTKDTWYRRIAYSGGCEHISNVVKITITPPIANNLIQADQIICYNNKPATITGTAPSGGYGDFEYLWQSSIQGPDRGWVTAAGVSNEQHYSPQVLTQTTWFRRLVVSSSRIDESAAVMITVNPVMDNNVISTNQTVCYDTAPSSLTGSVPTGGSGNYTYLWEYSTTGPNSGFATAPGANNRQDYNPYALKHNTWFRRVVTSESCEALLSNAVLVTVTPLPPAPVVSDVTICGGNSATLTASGKGGRLEWYASAAGGTPVHVGNTFNTPVLFHTTTYYVQEVQSCVSPRAEVTVNVSEVTANAGPDVTIIKGRKVELHATGGISYTWSPATGLNDPYVANPTATPEETTTYTVTVETKEGCVFTDDITITVLPFVSIPNTFTPNRDGINDTWMIENISSYPNCKVQIFNQWGNLVFRSDGYKAPWDGSQNGQELPLATYYYVIQLDKDEKPMTGSITIVK